MWKRSLLFPLVVVAAATGCGDGDKKPTQVVAKINGDEITIHQVNTALLRQRAALDRGEEIKRQALEQLIDQLLAKQQAIEKKLDRTPAVLQALEAARAEILARAYLEQIVGGVPKAAPEQVKKYYAEHPELFSERRVYSLEEVTVVQEHATAAKQQAATTRDPGELAAWLKSQNMRFAQNRGVRAAEQIPMEWLRDMQKMKEGDTRIFESGGHLTMLRVLAVRPAPLDESTAAPRIEQFLFNRKLREAIAAELKHLREKSNIEYTGEFARVAGPPGAEPEVFQPAQAESSAGTAPNFEKGIRGLR